MGNGNYLTAYVLVVSEKLIGYRWQGVSVWRMAAAPTTVVGYRGWWGCRQW